MSFIFLTFVSVKNNKTIKDYEKDYKIKTIKSA